MVRFEQIIIKRETVIEITCQNFRHIKWQSTKKNCQIREKSTLIIMYRRVKLDD